MKNNSLMETTIKDEPGAAPLINACCQAGWGLILIPPVNGKPTKGPTGKGWNQPRSQLNKAGYSSNPDDFKNCYKPDWNVGMFHPVSHTLAFDIDDLAQTLKLFDLAAGIQLSDWLNDTVNVQIKSPKTNRAKLIFKLPDSLENPSLKQFKHAGNVVLELRCGNCQDVISGRHPDGGEYQFIGNPARLPTCPPILVDMLTHWDDWKTCLTSVLSNTEGPPIKPRVLSKDDDISGYQNPILVYNQTHTVRDVLVTNGYQPCGPDRFIRPNSSSKAPGIVILRNCTDGIERIFSHGGDVLNDGFAHDAFDCFRLLEYSGDMNKALKWNPALRKENQRVYKQHQASQEKPAKTDDPVTQTQAPDTKTVNQADKKDDALNELSDNTALNPNDLAKLHKINQTHAHIVLGGKNVIVSEKHCQVQGKVLSFEVPAEFKKKFLHEPRIGGKKNAGQAWLEWVGKRYLPNGTGFYPNPSKCPPGVFNFFQGFRVKPKTGDCSIYLDHLKNIICAGDEIAYQYLVQWLAHLFQKPDEKPNVAIVLKSVEGTGKGTMIEPILEILGIHGNKTNGAYAIAGRFNGVVANRLLIFADEVDLTDKHLSDRLKSIITETSVNLERKGLEIEPLPNFCRLIFASNQTRVLNAGIRERRYLVLEPLDEMAQNTEYFQKLWEFIRNDGAAKVLDYLLQLDINDFNPYKCPQTRALVDEKLANLNLVYRYFYEQIIKEEPFDGLSRITAPKLIEDFIGWSARLETDIPHAAAKLLTGKMMAKLNIGVQGRSDRGGKYYELSSRDVLVKQFANLLGMSETELDP